MSDSERLCKAYAALEPLCVGNSDAQAALCMVRQVADRLQAEAEQMAAFCHALREGKAAEVLA